MSSYIGRHAELYDLFYSDKPYQQESAFIHQCFQKYSHKPPKRLLELACGTGTHALELGKYGYDLLAVDYSQDMLDCARRKAKHSESAVEFRWQDIRALDLPERPFDAVYCLFDSIGYVRTNEALLQVFKDVYNYLIPGGLFIFEYWHAAAMLRSYSPLRIRRWSTAEGDIIRISETELDFAKQLSHVTYTIYELRNDGTYSGFSETQTNRYFLVQEMSGWLTTAGLEPLKYFAGFRDSEEITEDTWHILAIARR